MMMHGRWRWSVEECAIVGVERHANRCWWTRHALSLLWVLLLLVVEVRREHARKAMLLIRRREGTLARAEYVWRVGSGLAEEFPVLAEKD